MFDYLTLTIVNCADELTLLSLAPNRKFTDDAKLLVDALLLYFINSMIQNVDPGKRKYIDARDIQKTSRKILEGELSKRSI